MCLRIREVRVYVVVAEQVRNMLEKWPRKKAGIWIGK